MANEGICKRQTHIFCMHCDDIRIRNFFCRKFAHKIPFNLILARALCVRRAVTRPHGHFLRFGAAIQPKNALRLLANAPRACRTFAIARICTLLSHLRRTSHFILFARCVNVDTSEYGFPRSMRSMRTDMPVQHCARL